MRQSVSKSHASRPCGSCQSLIGTISALKSRLVIRGCRLRERVKPANCTAHHVPASSRKRPRQHETMTSSTGSANAARI